MKISVAMPTYKRLSLLKRAVADVQAQTFANWELVVSDDEKEPGETWAWLQELAKSDQRVKVFRNIGENHGQIWNVNNALRQCTGDWVKPFFDDDRMHPNCLAKMLEVAECYPAAAMIGCRAQKWRSGQYVGDDKNYTRHSIEVVRQEDCRRAIFLYDRWNGRTPQHMMIRRSAIEAGAVMPEDEKYQVPVDWIWFSRVLDHGDYVMLADVLVEQHEGEVSSVTSNARADELAFDEELQGAYYDIWEETPEDLRAGIHARDVNAEICGVRGFYHLKRGCYVVGMRMMLQSFRTWRGPLLVVRWLLQETFHGRFNATYRAFSKT